LNPGQPCRRLADDPVIQVGSFADNGFHLRCSDHDPCSRAGVKNAKVRTSMLWRGGAPDGVFGSMKEQCGVNRARPSVC